MRHHGCSCCLSKGVHIGGPVFSSTLGAKVSSAVVPLSERANGFRCFALQDDSTDSLSYLIFWKGSLIAMNLEHMSDSCPRPRIYLATHEYRCSRKV